MEKRKSRVGPKVVVVIDLHFVDDISLLPDEIGQAQELLLRVEKSVGKVGSKWMQARQTHGLQ